MNNKEHQKISQAFSKVKDDIYLLREEIKATTSQGEVSSSKKFEDDLKELEKSLRNHITETKSVVEGLAMRIQEKLDLEMSNLKVEIKEQLLESRAKQRRRPTKKFIS